MNKFIFSMVHKWSCVCIISFKCSCYSILHINGFFHIFLNSQKLFSQWVAPAMRIFLTLLNVLESFIIKIIGTRLTDTLTKFHVYTEALLTTQTTDTEGRHWCPLLKFNLARKVLASDIFLTNLVNRFQFWNSNKLLFILT